MARALRLYLVRHAHVDYAGPVEADHPLSLTGEAQAGRLVGCFRDVPLDRILSSPLRRAAQTVAALSESKNLTIEVRDWLREYPDALFAGERLPAYWAALPGHAITSWEGYPSADELQAREGEIYAGLGELLAEYGLVKRGFFYEGSLDKDVCVVLCGHVGSLASVAAYLMNLHTVHCLLTTYLENGAVNLLELRDDLGLGFAGYRCWLRFWNQCAPE